MKKINLFLVLFVILISFMPISQTKTFASNLSSAESMIVIESSTNRIFYSKNENKKLPMASTTKILTAITAIENCSDLDKKFEIPKEAVGIEGSSIYLKSGEHLSVRELLYGLMLRSGNDSAVAIAIIISGSVDNFVNLMNEKVKELNLSNTHIVTVNGLHNDNHYTSAYDLAIITSYAMKNKIFKEIVSTKEIKISNEFGKNEKYRFLKNKNKLLFKFDGADGVKTGYTRKAGRCFVGSATRNNMQLICVVLNCIPMFEETSKLLDKGFSEYKMTKIFSSGKILEDSKFEYYLQNDIVLPLKEDEITKITAKIKLDDENLEKTEKSENGKIEIDSSNNLIFSEKIYTIRRDNNKNKENRIQRIIRCF